MNMILKPIKLHHLSSERQGDHLKLQPPQGGMDPSGCEQRHLCCFTVGLFDASIRMFFQSFMARRSRSPSQRELDVERAIAATLQGFEAELCGSKVVLFGSRAQGVSHKRSDFDVGILGQKPVKRTLFFEIKEQLEKLPTLYKIDLVDLMDTDPDFRAIALQKTKTLLSV